MAPENFSDQLGMYRVKCACCKHDPRHDSWVGNVCHDSSVHIVRTYPVSSAKDQLCRTLEQP